MKEDLAAGRILQMRSVERFRTNTVTGKFEWLNALKWLAGDHKNPCQGQLPLPLSPPKIYDQDAELAVRDISTVDLPFARARQLLFILDRFRCLGLKKGRDARFYMLFQLEMYAWKSKVSYASRHDTMLRMRVFHSECPEDGVALGSFHGLDFQNTLQRLCLMRYGKDCSLSYADQMDEYYDCNINADFFSFFSIFQLKMQKEWRIAAEK